MAVHEKSIFTNPFHAFTVFLFRQRGLLFGVILLVALVCFEVFNYSTTQFALADILGDFEFLGIKWATILAISFCGIDFAGVARLFTPEDHNQPYQELWFLFGAWIIAATMNSLLTWWGVSIALSHRQIASTEFLDASLITQGVPVVIAIIVWVTRFLLISTFAISGSRIFSLAADSVETYPLPQAEGYRSLAGDRTTATPTRLIPSGSRSFSSRTPAYRASRSEPEYSAEPAAPLEPSYHSLNARPRNSSPAASKKL
jgi:hypothetical protein